MKHWKLPVVLTLLVGLVLGSVGTANAQTMDTDFTDIPIEGTFEDAVGGTGTFEGTLDITRFRVIDGALTAVGRLTGTATDSLGNVVGSVNNLLVRIPVTTTQVTGVCDILHLELGPIDLDLLGLVVHVDQIVIDIDAEQGPGNLLGNLLCAIAGLLDPSPGGGGLLQALAQLLNQVLTILG